MTLPATDDFNRADENPLSDGGKWSTVSGFNNFKLLSKKIYTASGGNSEVGMYWNSDSFNNDQYSQARLGANSASNQWSQKALVRSSASAKTTYMFGNDDGSNYLFQKYVAGTNTQLGSSVSQSAVLNDLIKVTVTGTTIEGFINGVSQGTRTDSSIASGAAGLAVYYGASAWGPTWEGGNVGGGVFDPSTGFPWPDTENPVRERMDIVGY